MASPITWKNINSQVDTGAVRLLDNAQQSFNAGLSGLGKIVDQEQALRAANRNQVRGNNLTDITSALNKFKTVGEFNDADQAGQIDSMLAGYGNNFDRNAVNALRQSLPGQLMARENTENTFNDNALQREVAPIMEQIAAANVSGDDPLRDSLTAQYKDILTKANKYSGAVQAGVGQDRSELEQGWGDETQKFNVDQRTRTLTQQQAGDQLNALTAAAQNNYFTDGKAQEEANNLTARDDFGLQLDDSNQIDYDNSDPAKVLAYSRAVASGQVARPLSQTDAVRQLMTDARNIPGANLLSPEQLTAASSYLDSNLMQAGQLAQADAQQMADTLTSYKQQTGMDTNTQFLERGFNPVQSVSALISEFSEKESWKNMFDDTGVQTGIVDAATNALQNGVDIEDAEGKSHKVKLVPSDVKNIMQRLGPSWFFDNEDERFQEELVKYATSPEISDRNAAYDEYSNLENNLTAYGESRFGSGDKFSDNPAEARAAGEAALRKLAAAKTEQPATTTTTPTANPAAASPAATSTLADRYSFAGDGKTPVADWVSKAFAPSEKSARFNAQLTANMRGALQQGGAESQIAMVKRSLKDGALPNKNTPEQIAMINAAINSNQFSAQEKADLQEWLQMK